MPSETLLLAHLSDVHLAPMPRVPLTAIRLKRALGAANWYRNRQHVHVRGVLDALVADLKAQRPGHIAVTGDLVNLGLPAEHEAALRWLQGLGPPEHVTVVPGNHDAYVRMRGDPGHWRWQDYMAGDAGQDMRAAKSFPFLRRRGPVALIGLGSGVPTPPFVSAGQLGGDQLMLLRGQLSETGQDRLLRVILIHHPPHRYRQEWRTGLKDAGGLEDVVRAKGAGLILHGHFHRAQLHGIDGPSGRIPVVGVPSASAAVRHKGADLAGYCLYAIARDAGGGAHRIEMIRRGFAEPGGPIIELERTVIAG